MSANSILVVEDEPDILELLRFTLSRQGFDIKTATNAESALRMFDGPLPALAIIDWMLPGMSGLELAKRIRRDSATRDIPIIILTARSGEADKLQGFDYGADGYITKPFSPRELVARIRALLRRVGNIDDGRLTVRGIEMDTVAHAVSIDGKAVHLRPTEYKLLELMMCNPNRAYRRGELLDKVWGRDIYVDERVVDVHVVRLRSALKPHNKHEIIKTVRGVGYRLDSSSPAS